MLAAGRPDDVGWLLVCWRAWAAHRVRSAGCTGARSEFQRARETRPPLYGETRADPRAGRRRPGLHPSTVELEAEAEAVRRAGDPLGPATRKAPEHAADVDNAEAVKRLI